MLILSHDSNVSLTDPLSPERNMPATGDFTDAVSARLQAIHITVAAERHLHARAEPCPDHQECRRLAFARWLCMTGRVSEDVFVLTTLSMSAHPAKLR
jgi:hypothetical protein